MRAARMSSCPYARLGVARDATEAEVKRAWLRTCRLVHPDKSTHMRATEASQHANEAKNTIDAEKKAAREQAEAEAREAEEAADETLAA